MKNFTLIATVALMFLVTLGANAQQGFGTNEPDKSAAVDIVSSKRGLLIPRIDLTSTTLATPVSLPAQSLLVYNKATAGDVTPGFYFWDTDKWVRFMASADVQKSSTVTEGENITVTSVVNDDVTDYEVAIKGGTDGQVLVTKVDEVTSAVSTVWIDPADFVKNVITADNGLNIDAQNNLQLGGALTVEGVTTIATNGAISELAISGLTDISSTFVAADNNIMVMNASGVLKRIMVSTLVKASETVTQMVSNADGTYTYYNEADYDAAGVLLTTAVGVIIDPNTTTVTVLDGVYTFKDGTDTTITTIDTNASAIAFSNTASELTATTVQAAIDELVAQSVSSSENGLTIVDNNIKLGGALIEAATTITTATDKTLAIAGLEAPGTSDEAKIVMVDANGVLRSVARSLEHATGASFTVSDATITGYNKFVPEITISANIGASDLVITLPAATAAKGQVINVKIANTTEPDAYVNIPNVDGVTIYGSMPFQGWIIKSNGTTWSVVGRN